MPQPIAEADSYLLARASEGSRVNWLHSLMQGRLRALIEQQSLEIVDEEVLNSHGDIGGAVLKIIKPLSTRERQDLFDEIMGSCPSGVSIRFVLGAASEEVPLDRHEFVLERFRREFAVDGLFSHGVSCTKLTHLTTGLTARSTMHRSALRNDEEAMLLLKAILKDWRNAA